jgi:cytidine deaminase
LKGSQITSIIEYQRPVHAEEAAITDAAARGQVVKGAVLYCTTFPCHLCFKAILAAQVGSVRYIDPYPKSRAATMYPSSSHKLLPYEGIAPAMYLRIFEGRSLAAADSEGHYPETDRERAQPIVPTPYLKVQVAARERKAVETIHPSDTSIG